MITLTPCQSRAGRCHLNWSRKKLASVAGVSPETIKNFETGTWQASTATKAALIEAFEAHGLEFFKNGVKRRAACANCGYPHGFVTPGNQEAHEKAAP
jgi:DNA-binding XRE family transcriptional regulator